MMASAASLVGFKLICFNPFLGRREFYYTLTHLPAVAVYTTSSQMSKLVLPLLERPQIRLIVYDICSEVPAKLQKLKRDVQVLRASLGNKVKVISIHDLCRDGLEVLEGFELTKDGDPNRVWGHHFARTLSEERFPAPGTLTNGQMAAGST